MTDSQLLQEVRALLASGWCQGAYHGSGARFCLVGAIREVQRRRDLSAAEMTRIVFPLLRALPIRRSFVAWGPASVSWGRLVQFNDTPGMTRKRVLQLIDRALVEVTK